MHALSWYFAGRHSETPRERDAASTGERAGGLPPSARDPHDPLEPLRALARVQDELVRIPGTRIRFGLDALAGLIPGVGDALTTGVSAYVLLTATRMGAPPSVIARMAGNVALDLLLGAVPLLGDLFDVGWKANTRNVRLLERHAVDPRGAQRSSRLVLALALLMIVALMVGVAWLVVRILGWLFTPV
jgi:hypothetical protein